MATGFDDLLEFLLSEIALCGVQGAGSIEFRRFIQIFYQKKYTPGGLGRSFYEKVWDWVNSHGDVRVVYHGEPRTISLLEFEALELQETGINGAAYANEQLSNKAQSQLQPIVNQSSFRLSLRQRLLDEDVAIEKVSIQRQNEVPHSQRQSVDEEHIKANSTFEQHFFQESAQTSEHEAARPSTPSGVVQPPEDVRRAKKSKLRGRRKIPKGIRLTGPLFDDPSSKTTAPRLYASQNRIWQAVAGHSIDLQKLPSMEFVLLSIIASHGASGIAQPELVKISGQDKRSVPHRTDELARKGYIEKTSMSTQKIRTSLCVHKRFIKADHFLKGPGVIEDVFRNENFMVSSFPNLLHSLLKNVDIIAMRDLRRKLGVSVEDWSRGRAVRNAIRRLDETGFIKRVRARKKGSKDLYLVCIKLLRAPTDDDVKNLRFKRKVLLPESPENPDDNLLESDEEGDALERDLQLDMEAELEVESDDIERIPAQWTPERIMANLILEAANVAGVKGSDSASLRHRTVGKFWKRPVESYISRLTDSWEQSQPLYLRHLALVRDTAVSNEKKFLHYVYRTYDNYDKAVEQGDADWEVVSIEARKKSSEDKGVGSKNSYSEGQELDPWGFLKTSMKEFEGRRGSSTIAECRASINRGARQGPHWDNALAQKMGYEKYKKYADKPRPTAVSPHVEIMTRAEHKLLPKEKCMQPPLVERPTHEPTQEIPLTNPIHPKIRKQQSMTYGGPPLLTTEQRVVLGLPPKGRLGAEIEMQIRNYRKKTGDPAALPAVIIRDARTPRNVPLLSKEERRAQGLSELGRLPKAIENQIRLQRGVTIAPPRPKKQRKKRDLKEPPLLTMEQRIARGLPERGRLKQSIIDEILRERNMGMSPESPYDPTDPEGDRTDDESEQPDVDLDEISDALVSAVPFDEVESTIDRDVMVAVQTSTPAPVAQTVGQPEDVPQATSERADMKSILPPVYKDVELRESSPYVSAKRKVVELTPDSQLVAKKVRRGSNLPSVLRSTRQSRALSATTIDQTAVESTELASSSTPQVKPQVPKRSTEVAKRPDPGVYINPFATRPLPRGRPKNAFMAIFKSARLRQLEWFKPAPINLKKSFAQHSTEQCLDPQKGLTVSDTGILTSPRPGPDSGHPKDHVMTASSETDVPVPTKDTIPLVAEQQVSMAPEEPTQRHSVWNPINSSAPCQSTTYRSPYASTLVAQSPAQAIAGRGNDAGGVSQATSVTPVSAFGTLVVTDDERDLSNTPDMHTVSHSHTSRPWIHPRRGVVIGKGSHTRYRTSLVYDIILRCNGVFPGNGEILIPFYTLWDQRAPNNGHKPDRSTLARTLKDMVQDPELKLKKMTFIMPTLTGSTTMEKSIYALTKHSSSSPEVKALQENMIKAHPRKFYPEGIRDLVHEEPVVQVQPVIEIDDSVEVNSLYPSTSRKLDHRIEASAKIRKSEKAKKKQKDTETRKSQNAEVEKTLSKRAQPRAGVRAKVPRLATLNDNPRTYRRVTVCPQPAQSGNYRENSLTHSDSSGDTPLSFLRPLQPVLEKSLSIIADDDEEDSSSDEEIDTYKEIDGDEISTTLVNPGVRFTSSNGTFSTEFTSKRPDKSSLWTDSIKATFISQHVGHDYEELRRTEKEMKRVRTAEPGLIVPRKKRRLMDHLLDSSKSKKDLGYNVVSDLSDDEDFIAEISDEDEDDDDDILPKRKTHRRPEPDQPTLVERLTGLTGNQDDPIPVPPVKRSYRKQPKRWTLQKTEKEVRTKKAVEVLDPFIAFRKLCCTLVVAFCMSGEDRYIDWNIVANVFSSDQTFNLLKTKSMWVWMQVNMASQLKILSSTFQSSFLEAYEKGKVASIEDPTTHDWASVVQWALKKCEFPPLPLPINRDDLRQFTVVDSSYETFSRLDWYRKDLSHIGRSQRLLHQSYASPIHSPFQLELSSPENVIRARSWIRANTATPQAIYDGKIAHEKLSPLGITTLERGVTDLVDNGVLRMRQLKRLLPGRNYNFMASIALQYRRTFELEDFMDAAAFKKILDAAFVTEDVEKRAVSVARTANNGAVMAILSLLNDDRVKLIPKLPPVNCTFNAPLPRLSVWGFSEGDYAHRAIDRNRLFWDINVVPTSTYQFGNPLEPSPSSPTSSGTGEHVAWSHWTEPPLPGKNDPQALLPIWSSIDGQSVTWPWWNRILNIVIQSIMFQPGVTAAEIHRACPSNTVELFEVKLVVSWLLEVDAVHEPTPNTFEVKPGYWAAFGDRLIGDEDDWFGKHVRRKKTTSARWRKQYNIQFATLNGDAAGQRGAGSEGPEKANGRFQGRGLEEEARRRILLNPNQQYRVVREAVEAPISSSALQVQPVQAQSTQEDVIMVNSDENADGELDAEGESDDEL